MDMNSRVHVLLATYNGVRYLSEQLKSIEAQTLPVTRVTIRDDGSTDGTQVLLQQWAAGKPNVRLVQGARLGVTNNFFTLLRDSQEDCSYFAFCDQDDVWLPGKIERAVLTLQKHRAEEPLLYCSRLEYVDENLRHLGYSRVPRSVGFGNALVENVATGCTTVMTRQAKDLICRTLPLKALLHDWWCYLVISAFGKVLFDQNSTIKYRQHVNNRVGASTSHLASFRSRVRKLLRRENVARHLVDQAADFYRIFGDLLSLRDKSILLRLLSVRDGFWARTSYMAEMDVWRQSWIDTTALRTMILLGRM